MSKKTMFTKLRKAVLHDLLAYLDVDLYMNLKQASAFLGVSPANLQKRLSTIPHYRLGTRLLFKKSEIDEWMQQFRVEAEGQDVKRLVDEITDKVLGHE